MEKIVIGKERCVWWLWEVVCGVEVRKLGGFCFGNKVNKCVGSGVVIGC